MSREEIKYDEQNQTILYVTCNNNLQFIYLYYRHQINQSQKDRQRQKKKKKRDRAETGERGGVMSHPQRQTAFRLGHKEPRSVPQCIVQKGDLNQNKAFYVQSGLLN
ncbi:hypothetical protein OXYTRIMIC_119 [Oxytricha trifallax]|uniref:Uncharacterized protein n=1 Tax=Oxytricha trifallax TaxID=1172189 RepID=A0A073HYS4_9SPIT|nr:hypothetical protein OXYTRIMIC_119 [Oxytricha trifallax]